MARVKCTCLVRLSDNGKTYEVGEVAELRSGQANRLAGQGLVSIGVPAPPPSPVTVEAPTLPIPKPLDKGADLFAEDKTPKSKPSPFRRKRSTKRSK